MNGGLFSAAMRMCDDCARSDRPLRWFGSHIRICEPCRTQRIETNRLPIDLREVKT